MFNRTLNRFLMVCLTIGLGSFIGIYIKTSPFVSLILFVVYGKILQVVTEYKII
jgi:hypothetical protein